MVCCVRIQKRLSSGLIKEWKKIVVYTAIDSYGVEPHLQIGHALYHVANQLSLKIQESLRLRPLVLVLGIDDLP